MNSKTLYFIHFHNLQSNSFSCPVDEGWIDANELGKHFHFHQSLKNITTQVASILNENNFLPGTR